MGDWLPSRPGWWDEVAAFGSDPTGYVLKIVYGAIVGGLGAALTMVGTAFYAPIDSALDAVVSAGEAMDNAIQSAAYSIQYAERSATGTFIDLGAGAGLAAPFAQATIAFGVFAIIAVIVWVVVQVIRLVNPQ